MPSRAAGLATRLPVRGGRWTTSGPHRSGRSRPGPPHAVSTWLKEETAHEDTPDRLPAGVARGLGANAGEGEGVHPGARRAGGPTPADAVDGRGEGLPLRRAERAGEPARPVPGPPPADRLPRLLRAGHHHLRRGRLVPGPGLRRLLVRRRPGRAPGAPECPRHLAGVRLAGPAGGHRAPEGAQWAGS